ncbi:MAG TPA: elongation factor 1-beta [Thermoplasmatales archaeon]|nr:elongation factor 1-beta [Thermoplasmatales archaeon]
MAEVGIRMKIMPEGTDVDLDELQERVLAAVPDNVRVSNVDVAPVAFGLKALVIDFIAGDESPDALEEALSGVEGVARAEIEQVGRLF